MLTDVDLQLAERLKHALIEHNIPLYKTIVFGSRARGDHRENSDFDIAVKANPMPSLEWTKLQIDLSEDPITLYSVDLVDFNQLNSEYQSRILKEGRRLYVR